MAISNKYIGVVTEVLGQSRFYVFIYTNSQDVDSGVVILCLLRKRAKSKYKNSIKVNI